MSNKLPKSYQYVPIAISVAILSVNHFIVYRTSLIQKNNNNWLSWCMDQNSVSNNNESLLTGVSTALKSSSDLFLLHFLPAEKGQQYLSSVEEDSTQAEHMRRARRTFCTVITRINNASHTIGKDGKVCLVS